MNKHIYLSYGTMISPLGIGMDAHLTALTKNQSGIVQHPGSGFKAENWYLSKMQLTQKNRFDQLLNMALQELTKTHGMELLSDPSTVFIVSSTKGNIDALPNDVFESTRQAIASYNSNEIILISNACISGVIAVNVAADYIKSETYSTAIVIGIDVITDFVLFGFQSLFALSDEPARPFDHDRKGISLGEACGVIVVSAHKPSNFSVKYLAGASSNDANHISGPSRTGEGLYRAVNKTLKRAAIAAEEIDFVSAHGTATRYNDDMESIAFTRCNLAQKPINSLKGYFGHTLGAAGVIETLISMLSLEEQILFASKNYAQEGTTEPLNIVKETQKASLKTILKTASGFGGGNAAVLIQRIDDENN